MTGRSRYIQSPLSFTVNQSCVVRYRLPKETRHTDVILRNLAQMRSERNEARVSNAR